MKSSTGGYLLVASQNKGPMKIFRLNNRMSAIPLKAGEVSALIHCKDGRRQKQEIGYGSSFLSQSGRFLTVGKDVDSITVADYRGATRRLSAPWDGK